MSKLHDFKYKFKYYNLKLKLNLSLDSSYIETVFNRVKDENMDLRCIPTIITSLVSESLNIESLIINKKKILKTIEQAVRHICGTHDITNPDKHMKFFADHNKWNIKEDLNIYLQTVVILKQFGKIYVEERNLR